MYSLYSKHTASSAPRHHYRHQRQKGSNDSRIGSVLSQCGVSAMTVLYSYAMHTKPKGSDWSVRGGIDTGRPRATCRRRTMAAMTDDKVLEPGPPVTRCGMRYATQKEIKLRKLKRIKTFRYHFHIPLSHTTAKINQKVVYTTFSR